MAAWLRSCRERRADTLRTYSRGVACAGVRPYTGLGLAKRGTKVTQNGDEIAMSPSPRVQFHHVLLNQMQDMVTAS